LIIVILIRIFIINAYEIPPQSHKAHKGLTRKIQRNRGF
jgi:hypothetical protein